MSNGEGQGPARGYSWPPFQPGHEHSTQHGARSDRKLQPIVDELRAWAAENLPWASGPSFAPAVDAWCWAEARCVLYRRWFDEKGHHDDDEQPLAGLERWDRVETRAEKLREQLGIGPMALGKLLGALGSLDAPAVQSALDAVMAVGRELMERADQRGLPSPVAAELEHGDEQPGPSST